MNQDAYIKVLDKALHYFRHQNEIYGNDLILGSSEVIHPLFNMGKVSGLDLFRISIQSCQKCAIAKNRHNLVFGSGNPQADLIIIGEAPGEEEDLLGEPFVGKAGQLLDKILKAVDFQRQEVFIGNILKCRPPQNRNPQDEEIENCLPYLMRQIEIIKPKIILILGRIAAHVLLNTNLSLNQLRGTIHNLNGISIIVTYHPAALLRNPQWKRSVWEDIQCLRRLYDSKVGDKPKWKPPSR